VAHSLITVPVFAETAAKILENELVFASRCDRALEGEFEGKTNGFEKGDTVSMRKPNQAAVRVGRVADPQDVVEGKTTLVVDKQIGYDFQITSKDRTQQLGDLAERVIRPAMVSIAQYIDQDLASMFTGVWNAVGTFGTDISTFPAWMKGVRRLNEMAVPSDSRSAILSPADEAALVGNQSAMYVESLAKAAYRDGGIGRIAQVDTFMTQNAPVLTTGTRTNGAVNGASQATTYAAAKDSVTWGQTINIDGVGAAGTIKKGEIFTLAGVFAINPRSKVAYPYLQDFTVTADATADGSGVVNGLAIAPAIITTGAFQTVSAAPADNAVVTFRGTASTNYQQNLMFHRNAFSLAVVPLVMPEGAVNGSRKSHKGVSVRVVPYFDGTNDISNWRLDVLYGYRATQPGLATRING
jgi:hypothetical protein